MTTLPDCPYTTCPWSLAAQENFRRTLSAPIGIEEAS